jgi:CBS domain containing-hemolysin-like protein
VILLVALVLAGFAAAAETSITSMNRVRLKRLVEQGDARALMLERLQRSPNDSLTAILSTNTVAIIAASSAGTLLSLRLYGPHFPEWLTGVVLSIVVLMICEIAPKTYALRNNEKVALALARPVTGTTWLLRPAVRVITSVTGALVRPFGGRAPTLRGPFVTEEELKMLVTVGEEEGVLAEEEREMIHGIFEMGDMAVREVMIPRIDMIAVESTAPVGTIFDLITKYGHTRIPIYEGNIDHIVGVVYAKDMLRHLHQKKGPPASLAEIARKPYFVPESKKVQDLLREFQENKVHMAIVVDEYGGTAGLVTIEDLIEEIVGPIRDEYDVAEEDEEFRFLAPNEVVMDARVSVDDVNDLLNLKIAGEDFDSIGGYVYSAVGAIPKVGDSVRIGPATLTVESVRGNRIKKVKIRQEKPFELPEVPADGPPKTAEPERRG